MRRAVISFVATVTALSPIVAHASNPTPTPAAAQTVVATMVAPSVTSTPIAVPTSGDLPPTPPAPTGTPALPDEGGPAGGVLGGRLYQDVDGSGTLTAADTGSSGAITATRIDDSGGQFESYVVEGGADGMWEIRALPDGKYRVLWDPPVQDPGDLARTIPPATTVAITPIESVIRVQAFATITNGSRVLDINFGIPPRRTAAQLPSTGAKGGRFDAGYLYALGLIALGVGMFALAVVRRR